MITMMVMNRLHDTICHGCHSLHLHLKDHHYSAKIHCTLRLLIHFAVVLAFLYCGAFIFAVIEDSDGFMAGTRFATTPRNESNNAVQGVVNVSTFWSDLEARHDIRIEGIAREEVRRYFCKLHTRNMNGFHQQVPQECDKMTESATTTTTNIAKQHDKYFILMKWFYFVTTCTTTIGYGHIYPVTDQGKLFYIFFSIIGIALMMTLLRSCGSIITAFNCTLYQFARRHSAQRLVCDEMIAVWCTLLLFVLFMVPVSFY